MNSEHEEKCPSTKALIGSKFKNTLRQTDSLIFLRYDERRSASDKIN